MNQDKPARHPLQTFVSALAFSLVLNLGIVAGLGTLHAQDQTSLDNPRVIVPMTIVDPPPPPPETTKDNDEMASIPAAASPLPPLELPPNSGDVGAIEVPKTDANEFGWALDLNMPSFAGRSGKVLGQNLGTEASPPILLYQPDLASYYPSRARRAQITGKTQLSLEISANGEVTSIKITKSSPEGVFERAARRAAKKLHYKPSIRNGRPQSSKIAMEFIWKLD